MPLINVVVVFDGSQNVHYSGMASARQRGIQKSQTILLFFKSDLKHGQFGQRFRAKMPLDNSEWKHHTFIDNPDPQRLKIYS